MSARAWSAATLAGLLTAIAFAAAAAAETGGRPPNVVVIFADDLGYGDLGCYASKTNPTPCLDRLAAEGTRFTHFYVGQAVCTASRAALLTGCYPNRVGMAGALNHTSSTGIHRQERLLSELLKKRGYATAAFGKWHLGLHPPFWPTNRGFDEFFGIPYSNDNGPLHPVVRTMPPLPLYDGANVVEIDPDQSLFTRRFTDRAVRFIERHRDEPFFLYVPHVMPHVPIFASQEWRGKTGRGLYADVVAELDASVGDIVAAIDRHGLAENTLVVFASDNGPFLSYGNHAGSAAPLREGKLTAFEGGMRVPCIVRWPGRVPAGRVTDQIATTLDLFTSIVNLAGADMPKRKTDGLDLRPLLFGEAGAKGRETFFFYSGDELHAVRSGDWKLHLPHDYITVAGSPGRDGKPANVAGMSPQSMAESGVRGIASRHGYAVESLPLALFNVVSDPGETTNVAAEHPEVVARLQALAAEARADLGDALRSAKGAGARPVGDIRPALPDGVRRISDLEFAQTSAPVPMSLLLDLYLPASVGATPGAEKCPVVLWIHGGGWRHGSKEGCPLVWLAGEGVAVASINYRYSWQAQWPAQLDDCRAAVAWLRREAATYGLDPDRIVVAGGSAGGHLAALVGTAGTGDKPVQGVIDLFGPSDLLTMPANTPGPGRSAEDLATSHGAKLLGGTVHERPDLARAASALHHVSADDPPFLILHGDADPLVPVDQSSRLDEALRKAGVSSKLLVLAGAGHGGPAFDAPPVRDAIRQLVGVPASAPTLAKKPNVVILYADDLGYGDLHCYNPDRGRIPTPHLDGLAATGMRFTDGHSSSGVCSPSRYTLLTGRYHWRTRLQSGIVGAWDTPLIAADRLTVGGLAKQLGYRTACIGKWHLGMDWPIDEEERKLVAGFGGKNRTSVEESAATVTDAHREAWQRIFARPIAGGPIARGFDRYFGTNVPNWPPYCFIDDDRTVGIPTTLLPATDFKNNRASLQGPALAGWRLEDVLPALRDRAVAFIEEAARERSPFLLYMPLTTPHTPLAVNDAWKGKSGLGNACADLIMETDAVVGDVLAALDRTGASADTLVFFSSDNGFASYAGAKQLEAQGHHPSGPLRGYKSQVFEGGHRVPFIVRYPGVTTPGSVCDALVHQADILATVAEILGVQLPPDAGEDSMSLMPLLKGGQEPVRRHAVSCAADGTPSIRDGEWKLILWELAAGSRPKAPLPAELYDLSTDIGESENLAAKHPDRVAAMKEAYRRLVADGRSTAGPPQPNDVDVKRPR